VSAEEQEELDTGVEGLPEGMLREDGSAVDGLPTNGLVVSQRDERSASVRSLPLSSRNQSFAATRHLL
jgi:hypothetical protein